MARTETDAALFGISYLGIKDIFSTDNSSPQTTEINAKHRAPTLMKWVNFASIESLGLVALLTMTAPPGHKRWPLLGGLTSLVVTYGMYIYAKACGLKSIEDGTETWGASTPKTGRDAPGRPARGVTR
jgi:hypothetical protein